MEKVINFDMDGTLADFYGVEGWLDYLRNENTTPYREAKPLGDYKLINILLEMLQNMGYEINIISWGSKNSTPTFLEKTEVVKKEWLKKYFTINFDNIYVVPYGTPKDTVKKGILFDDDVKVRTAYNGITYTPQDIVEMLFYLLYK